MTAKANPIKRKSSVYKISYTKMCVRNNKLIIGIGACHQCDGSGTVIPTWEEPCGACGGKALIRYARFDRICHRCKGTGKRQAWADKPVTCPRCKGVNSRRFEKGQRNDYVHSRILARIPTKVYRLAFEPTESEVATFRSTSTLFGASGMRRRPDAALILEGKPRSACAAWISREDGTLALHFGIFVSNDRRYSGVVFDVKDVAWIEERNKAAAREARRRRREEKKCCPTCRRPFKSAA